MPITRLAFQTRSVSRAAPNNMLSPVQETLQCKICRRGFRHAAVLRRHLSLHEKEDLSSKSFVPDSKVFSCKVCDKAFKNTSTLVQHCCNNARTNCKLSDCLKRGGSLKSKDCSGSFAVVADFAKHCREHDRNTPEVPIQDSKHIPETNPQSFSTGHGALCGTRHKSIDAKNSSTGLGILSPSARRTHLKKDKTDSGTSAAYNENTREVAQIFTKGSLIVIGKGRRASSRAQLKKDQNDISTSAACKKNTQEVTEISSKNSPIVNGRRASPRTRKVSTGPQVATVCIRNIQNLKNSKIKNSAMCSKTQSNGAGKTEPKECASSSKTSNVISPSLNRKDQKRQQNSSDLYSCKVCRKDFGSQFELQKHAKLHDPKKPFGCDICGKFFDDARFVKTHRTLHEKKSRKECDICGKVFNERIFFDIHRLTHVEQKPFRCDICEDIFKDKVTFLRHCKVHKARTRKVAERFLSMKEVLKQKLEDSKGRS